MLLAWGSQLLDLSGRPVYFTDGSRTRAGPDAPASAGAPVTANSRLLRAARVHRRVQ